MGKFVSIATKFLSGSRLRIRVIYNNSLLIKIERQDSIIIEVINYYGH